MCLCAVGSVSGCPGGAGASPVISINITPTPTGVQVSVQVQFTATVNNDGQNKGVNWTVAGASCTGAACGTVSPTSTASGVATTYTAPADAPSPNASVTITATSVSDPTKSFSVTVAITPVPTVVSIQGPGSVPINGQAQFTATVSPAGANQAVTWTISCGSALCGSVNSATANPVTYTAPSSMPTGGTVTLTAASVGDNTKKASVTITITLPPISVQITLPNPLPSSVQITTTVQFAAMVSNDPSNKGVAWTATGPSCSGVACGSFSATTRIRANPRARISPTRRSRARTRFPQPAGQPSGPILLFCTSFPLRRRCSFRSRAARPMPPSPSWRSS